MKANPSAKNVIPVLLTAMLFVASNSNAQKVPDWPPDWEGGDKWTDWHDVIRVAGAQTCVPRGRLSSKLIYQNNGIRNPSDKHLWVLCPFGTDTLWENAGFYVAVFKNPTASTKTPACRFMQMDYRGKQISSREVEVTIPAGQTKTIYSGDLNNPQEFDGWAVYQSTIMCRLPPGTVLTMTGWGEYE